MIFYVALCEICLRQKRGMRKRSSEPVDDHKDQEDRCNKVMTCFLSSSFILLLRSIKGLQN